MNARTRDSRPRQAHEERALLAELLTHLRSTVAACRAVEAHQGRHPAGIDADCPLCLVGDLAEVLAHVGRHFLDLLEAQFPAAYLAEIGARAS
jgi:hypothetical protein